MTWLKRLALVKRLLKKRLTRHIGLKVRVCSSHTIVHVTCKLHRMNLLDCETNQIKSERIWSPQHNSNG